MARARAAAALACAVLVAGCGGIPSSSPVHVVRRVPAEGDDLSERGLIRRIPPPDPPPDTPPSEILAFYLAAQDDPRGDFASARGYLVSGVRWNTSGRTVVYAARHVGRPVVKGDRASVRVSFDPVGVIATTGEFRPRSAPVVVTFRLRELPDVGWRLVEAPAGLLLSSADVSTSFQRATLYWPDQARRLVPDPVFLRRSDQPVTTLVLALLGGPRGWLAPAVRTAIPKGTKLLGLEQTADGVVALNFSREIRGAAQETLGALVAQVVWTLTERAEVQAVRLLAEGEPIAIPGRPGVRDHRRADSAAYGPVPATADRRLFFVRDGAAYAVDDAGRVSRMVETPPLASFAVNRSGTTLAAVTRAAGGEQSLLLVDLTGAARPRTVLTADRIGQPTWEPGGTVVWVVRTSGQEQQVVAVPASGGLPGIVPVPAQLAPIWSLRLSPDGARAAVVAGPRAGAALWLARVERPASGGPVLGQPERVVPLRGVTAVAFDGAAQLLFATHAKGAPVLHRVDLDGFDLEQQRDAGLPAGAVSALTVSAGVPADRVASSAGRLWRRTPGADWAPVQGSGSVATFAG